jgi:hypothetical protein
MPILGKPKGGKVQCPNIHLPGEKGVVNHERIYYSFNACRGVA